MVFEKYALYYDLLYHDKNYPKEVNYILSLIKKHQSQTKNIQEFGSASGLPSGLNLNESLIEKY